jgi:uncharacterized protein YndB with AHSA1/START domain
MTDALRSVVVERATPHAPAKIWRALTDSSLIAQWLMDNDFVLEVGRPFQFRSQPMPPRWNGVTDCEVLAVEPQARLSYRWCSSGEEKADGLDTVVDWTLTPADGGTHVRVEQSGFRPEHEQFYQGARWGWGKFTAELERVAGTLPD